MAASGRLAAARFAQLWLSPAGTRTLQDASPFTRPGHAQMRTILIVDDSPTMRRMIIASLRGLGDVGFDQAGSGLEAIERLALAHVDLVVLDLNMPDVHGLEVLRFVRGHERFNALPVVVLTTRGDDESREAALREGASRYLTKPFVPLALGSEIRELLDAGQPS